MAEKLFFFFKLKRLMQSIINLRASAQTKMAHSSAPNFRCNMQRVEVCWGNRY